ncbi:unnamed protein product, partial [Mesorhabditis spiculigera]
MGDATAPNTDGAPEGTGTVSQTKPASQMDTATTTEERPQFDSTLHYLMTAIGYAVGLGNLWRFPRVAWENGGGAFLIPYFTCLVFFGMPLFYFESFIGQFTQSGANKVFFRYMPAFQGIGWAMALLSQQVNIYYPIIVGWSLVYIQSILSGNVDKQEGGVVMYKGNCEYGNATKLQAIREKIQIPTSEFFERYVLQRSEGIFSFAGPSWTGTKEYEEIPREPSMMNWQLLCS